MSKLAFILANLLKRAEQTQETQQRGLGHGLMIRVSASPNRLCLWRERGRWEPSEVAEREAHICAKHLGWGENYLLHWRGKYLICTQVEPLLRGQA